MKIHNKNMYLKTTITSSQILSQAMETLRYLAGLLKIKELSNISINQSVSHGGIQSVSNLIKVQIVVGTLVSSRIKMYLMTKLCVHCDDLVVLVLNPLTGKQLNIFNYVFMSYLLPNSIETCYNKCTII